MAVIETWLGQDLKGLVSVQPLQGQIFSLDNGGNLIGVRVTEKGQPVELEGTVIGYCILSDGQTVNVTGSGNTGIQNGNEAYIILPQLAYSVPGQINIIIKLTNGSTITTLAACTGYVYKSRTSNEVVPSGTPIPDLSTLEEAIRNANTAAESANAAATGAEKVDASMTKDGDVITITVTDRDGNVTEKTITDTADDVADLKSAFEQLNDNVITESAGPAPIVSVTDGADGMPMRKVEVAIEPVQDLHGYDSPWPAGGGVNCLPPMDAGTQNGVTIAVADDGTITINGTASTDTYFDKYFDASFSQGEQIYLCGFNPSAGDSRLTVFLIGTAGNAQVNLSSANAVYSVVTNDNVISRWRLRVPSGVTFTNFVCKPMLQIGGSAPTSYSPYSNVCPISGWTGAKVTRMGKNLIPYPYTDTREEIAGVSVEVQDDGSIKFNGTPSGTMFFNISTNDNNTILVPPGTYTLSNGVLGRMCGLSVVKNGNFFAATDSTGRVTFTLEESATLHFYISTPSGTAMNNVVVRPQLELGSTPSNYEPYKGQTYEITFPSEAGTVYGGTLDVVSGKLVVDRASVDLGTLTWYYSASENPFFYAVVSDIKRPTDWGVIPNWICSMYKTVSGNNVSGGVIGIGGNPNNSQVRVCDFVYATVADFKSAVTGQSLVYELATPITYQLTNQQVIETLKGMNNVWSDTGNTSITYPADTKMYIDRKITEAVANALNA